MLREIDKLKKDLYIIYWLGFKLIMYGFDLLIFYSNAFVRDNVAKKPHFFLIKIIIL